jgi:hypothetical protein
MSDTNEIRAVLDDATALRADVRVRGTAGRSVRTRARQRRTTALGSGAVAVVVCVVVGLLALTGGEGNGRTAVPASASPTTRPVPSPPALPEVAPGPQVLAVPIEIRPVRAEYPDCHAAPAEAATVPSTAGPACYRLGAPWLVVHRLDAVDVGFATDEHGLVSEQNGEVTLTMTGADRATFGARTAESIGRRVAVEAGGRVWLAPIISSPIPGGQLYLDLPVVRLRALLDALGIPTS